MAVPVRPSLRDRKKDATRAAIEDAAWALFTEQGFDVTTVHQIADRANVAPRTFFRYFPTKEAVLYPELDELLVEMRRAFHERPTDEPPLVSLIHAMDSISDEMSSSKSRQVERFEMLKRSGMAGSSAFVNERVVAAVADMVRERYADPAWFCYEDMGYKHIPGLLAWRVARLFVRGVWPTPAARRGAAAACSVAPVGLVVTCPVVGVSVVPGPAPVLPMLVPSVPLPPLSLTSPALWEAVGGALESPVPPTMSSPHATPSTVRAATLAPTPR